jgi:hypothetical protein
MKLSRYVLAARRARFGVASVAALVVLTGAFTIAGLTLQPSTAQAATLVVDQCNGHGPSAQGATTQMNCNVTVVNTISGTTTSSTTTVTRLCALGPCSTPNGTFTTRSTSLVTVVRQCNGSDNDSAHPINCNVTITNNISANTPRARPVTAATVNECVGSGAGGGGTVNCVPFPATTTGATVTQCNGSGNGGGGTVACSVGTASRISRAIPITVNQCNGTGNPGGSVVTCRTNLITNITAAASATPTATAAATPSSQVTQVPTGAVASGDGSTSGGGNGTQGLVAGVLVFAGLGGAVVVAARRRRRLNI